MATDIQLHDLPAGVEYLSRDSWGLTDAEAARRGLMLQPKGAVEGWWHHTAGSSPSLTPAKWDDDPVAWVKWLDDAGRNGGLPIRYRAVPYSFMFHKAPGRRVTIIEGRGDFFPAATGGRNTVSKALCFVGNFDTRSGPKPRSPRQIELDAARWLRFSLTRSGYLVPDAPFGPHSANPNCPGCTTCPGNLMEPHLADLDRPWLPPVTPGPTPDPTPEPTPTPRGALPDMYLIAYRKTGWPSEAIFRVTGREIIHIVNGNVAKTDGQAAPTVKPTLVELLALFADTTRTHVGENPFTGDFSDSALAKAW